MKIYFEAQISDRQDKFYICERFRSLDAAMKFWTAKFPDAISHNVTNDPESGTAISAIHYYEMLDNPFPLANTQSNCGRCKSPFTPIDAQHALICSACEETIKRQMDRDAPAIITLGTQQASESPNT